MTETGKRIFCSWIFIGLACAIGAGDSWSQDGLQSVSGQHTVSGQHIRLTTDVAPGEAADLVASFDAAVPQWEAFWQFPAGTLKQWSVDAYVMKNKAVFRQRGLIPPQLPEFPFGYASGNRVWVVAQKSEYYTRHLLLHEGVHALAFSQFGGAGPSWFMEGTAEMLSVHSGTAKNVLINQVPVSREAVPYWGRFKVMSARRDQGAIPSIDKVLNYPRDLQSDVESYGWSWAAVMLLYQYPEYRDAFFDAAKSGRDSGPRFNLALRRTLQAEWPVISARWRLMCHDIDYGFQWANEKVDVALSDKLWDGKPLNVTIAANKGWQSLGVRLAPGMRLKIRPSGTTTLANDPKPWVSEPAGVTIRYHRGRPLGQLLAVLVPNAPIETKTLPRLNVQPIVKPVAIGIKENCWMLFRVNDFIGELDDNTGAYSLQIQ